MVRFRLLLHPVGGSSLSLGRRQARDHGHRLAQRDALGDSERVSRSRNCRCAIQPARRRSRRAASGVGSTTSRWVITSTRNGAASARSRCFRWRSARALPKMNGKKATANGAGSTEGSPATARRTGAAQAGRESWRKRLGPALDGLPRGAARIRASLQPASPRFPENPSGSVG
jgi:hypothetical protein